MSIVVMVFPSEPQRHPAFFAEVWRFDGRFGWLLYTTPDHPSRESAYDAAERWRRSQCLEEHASPPDQGSP